MVGADLGLWNRLEPALAYLAPEERAKVREAYRFAEEAHRGQLRRSGEPYITHPVAVAEILAGLQMDADTVAAGLLHDTVEDCGVAPEELERRFGPTVRRIVEGETKVSKLYKLANLEGEERRAEDLRQMFIAMAEDVRIIIVKLADRLHNLRTLEHMPPEKQKRIAQETLEIYAPLAHRLGMGQLKWELEDLSFRYLHPEAFASLSARIQATQEARERLIQKAIHLLQETLARDELLQSQLQGFEVTGRPKHLYSIWKKMEREGKTLEQIYDLLAVRVILDPKPAPTRESQALREKQVCYHVLGLVHALWQPIPGRVKDYIAVPKPNGYQSLHTTVIALEGLPLEVQIRTREMHRVAEYGIAAHWLYKEGLTDPEEVKRRVSWLKSIQEWQKEFSSSREFVEAVTKDLLGGRVFVFTPKGRIINLPKGATPVDFAYHIHTEVGHHMVGAKVNGRIVPLSYELQNGEIVEILTSKNAHPSKGWLEFAKTRSAKSKIRQYFRAQERQETLERGQHLLERYLKRRGLPKPTDSQLEEAAKRLSLPPSPEELYLALALNRLTPRQVAEKLYPKALLKPEKPKPQVRNEWGIRLEQDLQAPIRLASCCEPMKGDPILGFVTRGRGVTVHRADCPNLRRLLQGPEADRVIGAYWEGVGGKVVVLEVLAQDRAGLLRDVMQVVAEAGKSALGSETRVLGPLARIRLRLAVQDGEEERILQAVQKVSGVKEARWA
ncbi:(p)ppGpp synthetase I SpoT/RelA [Thermus thermophilus]|uniref:RelA/SpoT family protein n=1 Tax=Thermus thermophilus TaxID=274 RepID=UPI00090A5155|nr:bifunctional (p)ppGpp synthetase/guanosine-3',5'-bis(diphosphate) 3'-pyrophosphohydrolase [Thermus thermophilus]BAW01712.1 (p)ppGpp synthetase I SpoT/RelA [Thermus thermophilus]BDB12314.1 guanosine-3',5'-bis(diphosphate) 3'-pyrophosphohydrolase [Thermus thermophilus]